jgi:hypothetical protein
VNRCDVAADLLRGRVELCFSAPGNKYVSALGNEVLRGSEADPSATPGDEGDFSVEFFGVRAHDLCIDQYIYKAVDKYRSMDLFTD